MVPPKRKLLSSNTLQQVLAEDRDTNNSCDPTKPTPLLSLPDELLEQLLAHVLPRNQTVNVTERIMSPAAKHMKREVAVLRGESTKKWRRTNKGPTAVLRTCDDLHRCGIAALWRENTYLFTRFEDITKWLSKTSEGPRLALKKLSLVPGNARFHNFDPTGDIGEWGEWNMAWPYDMSILASFPSLRELTVDVTVLRKLNVYLFGFLASSAADYSSWGKQPGTSVRTAEENEGLPYWVVLTPAQPEGTLWMTHHAVRVVHFLQAERNVTLGPLYAPDMFGDDVLYLMRDYTLRTIPQTVLENMTKLTVMWHNPILGRPLSPWNPVNFHGFHFEVMSEELLEYARSLPRIEGEAANVD